jgi:hypothetical protein
MTSVFTHKHAIEGNVGIGKLPENLHPILDDISAKYDTMIPDKSTTTYHTYYTDLSHSMKSQFDKIQYNTFWNTMCNHTTRCIRQYVPEMNELYYSNPKPNFKNDRLYGAAANLIPHRDCILYNFQGISLYRVIIGLTNNNNDTITNFIHFNLTHKINRGDYMIFDFDKTLHQVIKTGQQETPRILMKLHYIVCENCAYSPEYVGIISHFYKTYYYIARYTEQIGTDPKTFMGFFFGLMWELPFYSETFIITPLLFATNVVVLHKVYNINVVSYGSSSYGSSSHKKISMSDDNENRIEIHYKNIGKLLLYSSANMFALYLSIVLFYYLRYLAYTHLGYRH